MPDNEVPAGFELAYTEGDHLPFYQKIADVPQQPLPVDASAMTFANSTGSVGIDKLLGVGGQERYQTWPERLVRSGVSLPVDVATGVVPNMTGLRREDFTDAPPPQAQNGAWFNPIAVQPNDPMIERSQDMAGLAGLGSVPAMQKNALGSFGGKLVQVEHDPFAASNAPTFYSALEKAVDANPQSKMSGEQWLGTIRNSKGVKPEELEYSGLEGFLADKKAMTKNEVQDFIKNNKIELGESVKGKTELVVKPNPEEPHILEVYHPNDPDGLHEGMYGEIINKDGKFTVNVPEIPKKSFATQAEAEKFISDNSNLGSTTKFHQYQLPGGENYREVLMTLPDKRAEYGMQRDKIFADYDAGKMTRREMEKSIIDLENKLNVNNIFKSSHWDEPNVVAHMRMNDRTIDGKKSLHLEELQSDWHQKGRDTGYKLTPEQRAKADAIDEKLLAHPEAERIMGNPDLNAALKEAVDKKIITQAEATAYEKVAKNENATVPDAPFKKNWHDLLLKRALREAAEKGYDRLSWTPGEAQAARYDLSKDVSKVTSEKEYGTYKIHIYDKNGKKIDSHSIANENKLPDLVGKELAEKIVNQKEKSKDYEGLDLKIGGEGMKGFYDQIIPKSVQKLTGEKIQKGDIGDKFSIVGPDGSKLPGYNSRKGAEDYIKNQLKGDDRFKVEQSGQPIHYIDIPQKLKDEALQNGFPLFSSSPVMVPVDENPFSDHKLTPVDHTPIFE